MLKIAFEACGGGNQLRLPGCLLTFWMPSVDCIFFVDLPQTGDSQTEQHN